MTAPATLASGATLEGGAVRIGSLDGDTLGTGFVIAPGVVLTCHHVVDGSAEVMVRWGSGDECRGSTDTPPGLDDFDLALVRCSGAGAAMPAVATATPPPSYESRGHHYGGAGFTASLPLKGVIVGGTRLSYGRYTLDAWVLAGMTFGPGMSGAPLVDPETGVVVGVISTRLNAQPGALTGTGIPLHFAAKKVAALDALLRENDEAVPRYGRHLNTLGARAILAAHAGQVAVAYEDRGIFLRECAVERASLQAELDAFLGGEGTVLPVIGVAGTGKSSFVAALAETKERTVLVVPALMIDDPGESLASLCDRAMEAVGLSHSQRPQLDALFACAASTGAPAIVVVEGVNEARITAAQMQDPWLPTAAAWARRMGVKLVLTCRPEYWESVRGSVAEKLLSPGGQVTLGEFSDAELADALVRYGVPAQTAKGSRMFRHPLMLRILSELDLPDDASPQLRRSQAIERYLERRSAAVANRLAGAPPLSLVRRTLAQLASVLLERRTLDLERDTYDALTQPPPELGWALLRENLFFESGRFVRFTFDEISEFLIADSVTLDTLDAQAQWSANDPEPSLPIPVIVQVLRRAYDAGDPELESTVANFASASERNMLDASLVLREFLRGVPDATRFLPAIETMVRGALDASTYEARRSWTLDILGDATLPIRPALEMIRALAPTANGYGLRDKDRLRGDLSSLRGGPGAAMIGITRREGARALDHVATWLGDDTELAGGEGSVGSLAAMVLASEVAQWSDSTVQAIGLEGSARSSDLVALGYKDRPDELATLCERWIEDERFSRRFVLQCVDILAERRLDRALPLLRQLASRSGDSAVRASAEERLLRHGSATEADIERLLAGLASGETSLHSVSKLVSSHWDAVERALLARLDARTEGNTDVGGVVGLASFAFPPEIEARIAALLRRLYESGRIDASSIAYALELKFYQIAPDLAESAGFLALAERVAREAPAAARQCLAYVAFPVRDAPQREAVSLRLRAALLDGARDPRTISVVLSTAARQQPRCSIPCSTPSCHD